MFKEKIKWKLRYYYLEHFQNNQKNYWMYPAVRHLKKIDRDSQKKNLSDIKVKQYVTKLVNPTAGIGDQMASLNTGYFYAKLFKLHYAYSPLYPQSWNSFMGFNEKIETAKVLHEKEGYCKVRLPFFEHKNSKEVLYIKKLIQSYAGKKIVFYIEDNQIYGEQYGVADELRQKFNNASSRVRDKIIYDQSYINIAIHVRRGDITIGQLNQNPELVMRWLDNNYYVKILRQIVDRIKQEYPYRIYLFSQGKVEDFEEFNEFKNIVYCLDMGAQDSFLHLVRADVIITSKSSFSYKPALLSEGVKICPKNFWHGYPRTKDWIIVDEIEPILGECVEGIIKRFINRR